MAKESVSAEKPVLSVESKEHRDEVRTGFASLVFNSTVTQPWHVNSDQHCRLAPAVVYNLPLAKHPVTSTVSKCNDLFTPDGGVMARVEVAS